MADYNSTLFDIITQLELFEVKISEYEILEKTFSTFHASNIILQQQYQQKKFTKDLELIFVLLTAKQTNELLLKHHDLRPTRSTIVPKAHAGSNKSFKHSKGRMRR